MKTVTERPDNILVDSKINYYEMPLDKLVDYVVDTYHKYIREEGPALMEALDKVVERHGEHHPTLFELQELYKMSLTDLLQHIDKEEMVIFPYTRRMVEARDYDRPAPFLPMGTIAHPIEVMEIEHSEEQMRYTKLESLAGGYAAPDDADADYVETLARLSDFDNALRDHITIENTILFPRIIDLETELRARQK